MTEETKQLLLRYARTCENLFYEMSARQATLESCGRPGWRAGLTQMLADSALRELCHKKFQPLYANIQEAENLEKAMETFLRDLPPTGKPN